MKIDFTPRLQYTGAIAGIAIGVGGLVLGEVNQSNANKKAATQRNTRPKLTDSPYTKSELALTESELASGMGADASRYFQESQDSDISTATDTLLKGGGSVNNVAQIFDGSQVGRQRFTMMKENLRLNQIHNFVAASRSADQERQQEFQFNDWAPWADESQAIAEQKAGAERQISSGINTIGSGVVGALGSAKIKDDYSNYFKTGPGGARDSSPDFSPLETGGLTPGTPDVAGSVGKPGQTPQLNYNFNNSTNTNLWTTPGGS